MITEDLVRDVDSVRRQRWMNESTFLVAYAMVMCSGLVLTGIVWRRSPGWFGLAAIGMALTMFAWIVRPRVGLHLTVFFTLIGDMRTVSWFPFNSNLSSRQSLLYVSDALTITPLEITLGFALALTIVRNMHIYNRPLVRSPLLGPVLVFAGLVVLGIITGIGNGGDLRIAIYETRAMFYVPMVFILVTSVCTTHVHVRRLVWTAGLAVIAQGLLTVQFYLYHELNKVPDLEALVEHGSAVTMNVVFLLAIASIALKGNSVWARLGWALAAIPVLWMYLVSQRRAAMVCLGVALIVLAIVFWWRQRRTFWKVVPITTVVFIGYVGAFWNVSGGVGQPAQAVKSIVAPDQLSAADQSSDLYRMAENFNLHVTIRSEPLTGMGFGRPFLRPIQLADISFFEFYEYIPHNSVLYIWAKMGFFGFAAMFYLWARALMLGAHRVRRTPDGPDTLAAYVAVGFVMMFAVYAYVDIAWEARNLLLLGVCMAICASPLPPTPAPPAEDEPEGRVDGRPNVDSAGRTSRGVNREPAAPAVRRTRSALPST
jgi:hypothetical protein